MTERLRWPNSAASARDQSAELANAGIVLLKPMIEGQKLSEEERIRRVGMATIYFEHITRCLEKVGAPTIPSDLCPIQKLSFSINSR